jgi:hypothetical protein
MIPAWCVYTYHDEQGDDSAAVCLNRDPGSASRQGSAAPNVKSRSTLCASISERSQLMARSRSGRHKSSTKQQRGGKRRKKRCSLNTTLAVLLTLISLGLFVPQYLLLPLEQSGSSPKTAAREAAEAKSKVLNDADLQFRAELDRTAKLQADLEKLQLESAKLASDVLSNRPQAAEIRTLTNSATHVSNAGAAATVATADPGGTTREAREAPSGQSAHAFTLTGDSLPVGSYGGSCQGCVLADTASSGRLLRCTHCKNGGAALRGGASNSYASEILLNACTENQWISNVNGQLKCDVRPVGALAIAKLRDAGHGYAADAAAKLAQHNKKRDRLLAGRLTELKHGSAGSAGAAGAAGAVGAAASALPVYSAANTARMEHKRLSTVGVRVRGLTKEELAPALERTEPLMEPLVEPLDPLVPLVTGSTVSAGAGAAAAAGAGAAAGAVAERRKTLTAVLMICYNRPKYLDRALKSFAAHHPLNPTTPEPVLLIDCTVLTATVLTATVLTATVHTATVLTATVLTATVHTATVHTATVHTATVHTATVLTATVHTATVLTATVHTATVHTATVLTATVLTATVHTATVHTATVHTATIHCTHNTVLTTPALHAALHSALHSALHPYSLQRRGGGGSGY